MKISELIQKLEYLQSQYGIDVETRVNSTLYYLDIHQITDVREYNGKIEIIINK